MGNLFQTFNWLLTNSKKSDGYRFRIFFKSLYYKLKYGKYIFSYPNTQLSGIENIFIKKTLHIGTVAHELNHKKDLTKLNVQGKLFINSEFYHIARGCRIDVGKDAEMKIGTGGFINPFTNIIVRNGLTIGNNVYISWNCQVLDEDYHHVEYTGKKVSDKKIKIGSNVWIGTGVSIYQGTEIADGCVVASNAVVRGKFNIPNCIIGGNPAKIIKENIAWK